MKIKDDFPALLDYHNLLLLWRRLGMRPSKKTIPQSGRTVFKLMLGFAILLMPIISALSVHAQNIPILSFDQFQAKMKSGNDTVYVYNFWATWCKPCVQELPNFEKLNSNYKSQNLKVVLVSLDFSSQYEKRLVPFVKENKLKSEVILLDAPDYNDWIDKVNPNWSGAIPATAIISPKSGTNKFFEKPMTYTELEQIVKPLLNL